MKDLLAFSIPGPNGPIFIGYPVGTQASFTDLGQLFTRLLQYLFPLAGIILFVMIIISGFQMLTSAGDPKALEGAKQRLTWGVVGFVVIFVAFWLMRALEFILGITIL